MHIEVRTFPNSDFEENLYVVRAADSTDCVIIDPGLEPDEAVDFIQKNGFTPKAFLITHGHYDHVGGLKALKKIWPEAEIIIGEIERPALTDPNRNLSAHFGYPVRTLDADRTLADGEEFTCAGIRFKAILIPGHSTGHLVYQLPDSDLPMVFVGDVIFNGSIGRTDFPGGSTQSLLAGIKKHLLSLPGGTRLYTGHGPFTTPENERVNNPWLG